MHWWDRCMFRFWFFEKMDNPLKNWCLGHSEAVFRRLFFSIFLFFELFRTGQDQKVSFSSFFFLNQRCFCLFVLFLSKKTSTFYTFVWTTSALWSYPKSFWDNFTFVEHLLPWCSPNFLKQKLDNFFFILLLVPKKWLFFVPSVYTTMLLLFLAKHKFKCFRKRLFFRRLG